LLYYVYRWLFNIKALIRSAKIPVKYVNPVTKLCIVRVSREDHQKVWAAMTMVRCIGKIPVSFNLLDMSGKWLRLWMMVQNNDIALPFYVVVFNQTGACFGARRTFQKQHISVVNSVFLLKL
jgi:hypothetical protein